MIRLSRLIILRAWLIATALLAAGGPSAQTSSAQTKPKSPSQKIIVPRLWTAKGVGGWATPMAGGNASPTFYWEQEYYAAPVAELRTYPVYIPGREPKGYMDWIKRQGPRPL